MTNDANGDESVDRLVDAIAVEPPDTEHARRCAGFAAILFDGLAEPCGLAPADRDTAVVAAYLHDIGYIRGGRDHHRKSFDVIRELDLPFDRSEDRVVAACVARYHGTTMPSIEHAGFQDLVFDDQRRVRRLTGIVRMAVALDASHLGLVTSVEVKREDEHLAVVGRASEEPAVERDRLRAAAASMRVLAGLDVRSEIVVRR